MRAIETSPAHSNPWRPPARRRALATATVPLGYQMLVAALCGALAITRPAAAQIVIEPSARLEVLSYNTWLLNVPSPLELFGDDAPCYNGRGRSIGRTLRTNHDFDLVLLQESFDDGARERMFDELDGKYPYVVQKQPGGSLLGDVNGGLTILSKHPFLPLAPMWFGPYGIPVYHHAAEWKLPNGDDLCAGADCYANKGLLHVRISVGDASISVIDLHTDADDPGSNHLYVRYLQMLQLRDYLRDVQSYFPSDLLLVGGDFNIKSPCSLGCVDCVWSIEYDVTLPWLFEEPSGVDLPAREAWREEACAPLGGGALVWGPGADGSDGRTSTCKALFPGDCSASGSDECEPPGSTKAHRLDLLMFNDSHGASILRTSNVRVERFGATEAVGYCEDGSGQLIPEVMDYLSDHWGVAATFEIWPRYDPWVSEPGPCGPLPMNAASNPDLCGDCQCGPTDPLFCISDCPICGDGTCSACEDRRSCYADCGAPPPPPPPDCGSFDYSQCLPFSTCQYFCEIGSPGPIGPSCCGCQCVGMDECPVCLSF